MVAYNSVSSDSWYDVLSLKIWSSKEIALALRLRPKMLPSEDTSGPKNGSSTNRSCEVFCQNTRAPPVTDQASVMR